VEGRVGGVLDLGGELVAGEGRAVPVGADDAAPRERVVGVEVPAVVVGEGLALHVVLEVPVEGGLQGGHGFG